MAETQCFASQATTCKTTCALPLQLVHSLRLLIPHLVTEPLVLHAQWVLGQLLVQLSAEFALQVTIAQTKLLHQPQLVMLVTIRLVVMLLVLSAQMVMNVTMERLCHLAQFGIMLNLLQPLVLLLVLKVTAWFAQTVMIALAESELLVQLVLTVPFRIWDVSHAQQATIVHQELVLHLFAQEVLLL